MTSCERLITPRKGCGLRRRIYAYDRRTTNRDFNSGRFNPALTQFGHKPIEAGHREEYTMLDQESALDEKVVKTSDQILDEIQNEKNKQPEPTPANARIPEPLTVPSPEPEDTVKTTTTQTDKPSEPEVTSTSVESPVPFAEKDKAETEEWMKKKGFKSVQDMARSMWNLERKLHSKEPGPNTEALPPVANAPMPRQPMQPASQSVDDVAKHYGIDPEDLGKIGPIARDIAMSIVQQQLGPLTARLNASDRALSRRSAVEKLDSDPAFHDPEVIKEMHTIMESNPIGLKNNPAAMVTAFNMALTNIGRRKLEGLKQTPNDNPPTTGDGVPKNPPPTARGTGVQRKGSPLGPGASKISPEQFNGLSLAEKDKVLRGMGVLKDDD